MDKNNTCDQCIDLRVAQVGEPDTTTEIVCGGDPSSRGRLDQRLCDLLRWWGGWGRHGRLCWCIGPAERQQRGLVALWSRRLYRAVGLAFSRGHGKQGKDLWEACIYTVQSVT